MASYFHTTHAYINSALVAVACTRLNSIARGSIWWREVRRRRGTGGSCGDGGGGGGSGGSETTKEESIVDDMSYPHYSRLLVSHLFGFIQALALAGGFSLRARGASLAVVGLT